MEEEDEDGQSNDAAGAAGSQSAFIESSKNSQGAEKTSEERGENPTDQAAALVETIYSAQHLTLGTESFSKKEIFGDWLSKDEGPSDLSEPDPLQELSVPDLLGGEDLSARVQLLIDTIDDQNYQVHLKEILRVSLHIAH